MDDNSLEIISKDKELLKKHKRYIRILIVIIILLLLLLFKFIIINKEYGFCGLIGNIPNTDNLDNKKIRNMIFLI